MAGAGARARVGGEGTGLVITRLPQTRRLSDARRATAATKIVILAGGRGTRLAPYTSILPKPLMPIGDKPILEIIIDQLAAQRLTNITLCVGYLSHLIRSVLDGRIGNRAAIGYVQETEARGTAGPLRLVGALEQTFIAMNGDVLTSVDYRKLLRRHRASGNCLTIATSRRVTKMDYGVLHLDGSLEGSLRRVTAYEEKPELPSLVSMGIYVMEPRAIEYVPQDSYFDFPDLVHALLAGGEQVGAYVHEGPWFDIGRHEDYELAVQSWSNGALDLEGEPSGRVAAGRRPPASALPATAAAQRPVPSGGRTRAAGTHAGQAGGM
jgi:NDP-mannose synthase